MVEWNVLVRLEECQSLAAPVLVQIGIHTASLHDASKVEIGLTVANKVNFFGDQFSAILGPLAWFL